MHSLHEIQRKVAQDKKDNGNQIRQESQFIDNQTQMLRQKELLENKYTSSIVKQKEKVMKLNLHRFWDFRIRNNEIQKKKMILEQMRSKRQTERLKKQLTQKEEEL